MCTERFQQDSVWRSSCIISADPHGISTLFFDHSLAWTAPDTPAAGYTLILIDLGLFEYYWNSIHPAQFGTPAASITFLGVEFRTYLAYETNIVTGWSAAGIRTSGNTDLHFMGCKFLCKCHGKLTGEFFSLNQPFCTVFTTYTRQYIPHSYCCHSFWIEFCHKFIYIRTWNTLYLHTLSGSNLKRTITVLVSQFCCICQTICISQSGIGFYLNKECSLCLTHNARIIRCPVELDLLAFIQTSL